MQVTVTAKCMIEPDKEDYAVLHKTMDVYREACDFVSDHVFLTHETVMRKLHDELYYMLRSMYALGAQMTQSVLKTVIAKYKTEAESGRPCGICEFKRPQADLVYNRDYSFTKDGLVSVGTLNGRIKAKMHTEGYAHLFEGKPKFGTAKLVYKHNKFFLHIPLTYDVDTVSDDDVKNIVGIDRGIRFLVAAYDSSGKTKFFSGSAVKQKRAHYKEVRQSLQQTGTRSAMRRLKTVGAKENRWMQDVNHCIAKALVAAYPKETLFVLEDLTGIRSATEKVRTKDRYLSVSWSFYDLGQKILYKAHLKGQNIIAVNPAYTSQTCPACGHVDKHSRNKKMHMFCCTQCGYTSNDDRIAAMNLHRMGSEYLMQSKSGTPGL